MASPSGRAGTRPSSRSSVRAAARPSPAPSRPSPVSPRPSRFTGRAAVLVLVVAVLVVSYGSSMRAYLRQQHHLAALHTNIHHAKARIAVMQREKERWSDPHYVEARARARFGWVMPGEVGFQVIGRNGKLLDQTDSLGDVAPAPAAQQAAWWQQAWGSVVAAGDPPTEKPATKQPAPKMKIRPHR